MESISQRSVQLSPFLRSAYLLICPACSWYYLRWLVVARLPWSWLVWRSLEQYHNFGFFIYHGLCLFFLFIAFFSIWILWVVFLLFFCTCICLFVLPPLFCDCFFFCGMMKVGRCERLTKWNVWITAPSFFFSILILAKSAGL